MLRRGLESIAENSVVSSVLQICKNCETLRKVRDDHSGSAHTIW